MTSQTTIDDERYQRIVTCGNGHSFSTATASTWDGMYCPNYENGWQCLQPLIDSSDHLIRDLIDLRDELTD